MFYHYCTIKEETEVTHTDLSEDGYATVHFETPDEIYGFKTLDCRIPGYIIVSSEGYNEDELSQLVQFCRNNAHLILEGAKSGGYNLGKPLLKNA